MPKIKSNSTSKGRFKISGTGKILFKHTGKNHGMTKRSKQQIRDKRKQGETGCHAGAYGRVFRRA